MVNEPYGSNLVQRSKDARLGNNLAFKRSYFDQADRSFFSRQNYDENKLNTLLVELFVLNLAEGLASNRFKVTIYTTSNKRRMIKLK